MAYYLYGARITPSADLQPPSLLTRPLSPPYCGDGNGKTDGAIGASSKGEQLCSRTLSWKAVVFRRQHAIGLRVEASQGCSQD